MADFTGGTEAIARTDMLGMTNKLQEMQAQAMKSEKSGGVKDAAYLAQIKKVSQEFESIFLGYMLKQMRKTVPDDQLTGNSSAKDIFYDMHDDEVSKNLSKAGGIGIAAMVYKQLSSIYATKEPVKLQPLNAPQQPMKLKKTDIII
ncbi:MAG: rod-binding protein [Candidatus Goldiibacteriota bacterium]|jgi:flagellar protein FlgJ